MASAKVSSVPDVYPGSNSVIKRQVELMEAYSDYVSFVPTPKHMKVIELDATRLHPTLLRDSIKAAIATGAGRGHGPEEQRRIIHSIYARKAKEMAALWPFIFCVENAYRAMLTEHFHTKFGSRDWWRFAEKRIIAGRPQPTLYGGIQVASTLSRTIDRVVQSIMDNNEVYPLLRSQGNASRFFYFLSFGQLMFFVEDDWASLSAEFVPGLVKGQAITKSNILRDLATVREVRNELYHSNPIKNSQVFIRAVEALLLSLDINPGRFDDDLRTSTYDRPIFSDLSSGAIPAA